MRKTKKKEWIYLGLILVIYFSGILYVYNHNLSMEALFKYGLLQPKGIIGEEARFKEIDTIISWNIFKDIWYIFIKSAAILVELLQYWVIGMFIASALIIFTPWDKVKAKMGYGGPLAIFISTLAGAIIPICSCGIIPVLAGMVESGIPLGVSLAFLISAPMVNVPAFFITGSVLGWKLALGRILGTFFIAMGVGLITSYWQKKERFLRRFIKISLIPNLSAELQQFAFNIAMKLSREPGKLSTEELAPGEEDKLYILGEAGILERNKEGLWYLPEIKEATIDSAGACFVLPSEEKKFALNKKLKNFIATSWDLFLQLNYYLLLAVIIAGAIKVLLPTKVVINLVGSKNIDSVLISSVVAILAYICTYVEVPTALALVQKGMSAGATLAFLLGGPGLSIPSIVMLSGVFKPKLLILYVGLSFIGCVIAGYIFNLF